MAMQSTNSRAGKSKRPKLAADNFEVLDSAATESAQRGRAPADMLITELAVHNSDNTEASEALADDEHCLYNEEYLSRAGVYSG